MKIIKEACVTTVQQAIQAEQHGAQQLELCTHLDLDGLTPPDELIKSVMEQVHIPVKVLIRPRAGDFVYGTDDLQMMKRDILFCKTIGVAGVVTGVLEDNQLNFKALKELVAVANRLPVYIHKAIDETKNPLFALEQLRKKIPKISGVLTSGGAATAKEGLPILKKMMKYDADDFHVIVAGKVTFENWSILHEALHARYYHGRQIVPI